MLEDLNEFGENKLIIPSFEAMQALYTSQKISPAVSLKTEARILDLPC